MLRISRASRISLSSLVLLVIIALIAAFLPGALPRAQAQAGAQSVPEAAGVAFTSLFGGNHNGWSPVAGTWTLSGGAYRSSGLKGKTASIAHKGSYTTFDYVVRMQRQGCESCANSVIIRGDPSSLTASNDWRKAYWFEFSRDGWISVYKRVGGSWSALLNWTEEPAVLTGNQWNVLEVLAEGTSLSFYVNGTPVWNGTDSSLTNGRVGIDFYRNKGSTGNKLMVDYATMTLVADLNPFADTFAHVGVSGAPATPEEVRMHP